MANYSSIIPKILEHISIIKQYLEKLQDEYSAIDNEHKLVKQLMPVINKVKDIDVSGFSNPKSQDTVLPATKSKKRKKSDIKSPSHSDMLNDTDNVFNNDDINKENNNG